MFVNNLPTHTLAKAWAAVVKFVVTLGGGIEWE